MPGYTDDDEVAEEVDEQPAWVKEGTEEDDTVVEGEDVSGAEPMGEQSDWMEPAKGVEFEIKKATIDTYTPNGETEWKTRSLKLQVAITSKGTDGKGKFARKVFFPGQNGRILIAVNRAAYDFNVNSQGKPTDWYKPKTGRAFGDYNAWLTALGFPTSPAPRNDKAFRDSLVGRKVIADITKEKREVYDKAKGISIKVPDEYENHLRNVRPVKAATGTQTEAAEAAEA